MYRVKMKSMTIDGSGVHYNWETLEHDESMSAEQQAMVQTLLRKEMVQLAQKVLLEELEQINSVVGEP